MRLKNVKGSREKIETHENTIQTDGTEGAAYAGKWKEEIFKNDNPIHIEIGMGKGQFLLEMAEKYPDINFIGIEKFSSVLIRAIEKLDSIKADHTAAGYRLLSYEEQTAEINETDGDHGTGAEGSFSHAEECPSGRNKTKPVPYRNIIFMRMDAENIGDYFAPGEIDGIYLNFSDPWPKKRHERRRLTSHVFLEKYVKIMDSDGVLIFKTDNTELFEFSIREMEKHGWNIIEINRDLHHDGPAENNVMTEYERKFYGLHKKIMRLQAKVPSVTVSKV